MNPFDLPEDELARNVAALASERNLRFELLHDGDGWRARFDAGEGLQLDDALDVGIVPPFVTPALEDAGAPDRQQALVRAWLLLTGS